MDIARAGLAGAVAHAVAHAAGRAAGRAAGPVTVAALPVLAGTGPEACRLPDAFDDAFRRAMVVCAGVPVLGSVLAFATVRGPAPDRRHPGCRRHGSVVVPRWRRGRNRGRGAGRGR